MAEKPERPKLSTLFKMLAAPVKYITPDGAAIGYPQPLKTMLRPEFLTATAAAACLTTLSDKPSALTVNLMGLALAYTFSAINRVATTIPRCRAFWGDKVIHTQPTEEEVANSYKYRLTALISSNIEKSYIKTDVALHAIMGSAILATGVNPSGLLINMAAFGGQHYFNHLRFKKVADGTYAIVDKPEPDKLLEHFKTKERETTSVRPPVLQPAPVRA